MPAKDLFESTPTDQFQAEPFLTIEIPGRLPSWNDILGMEHWARHDLKEKLADAFSSELKASEGGSSTRTTCAASTTLTYSGILESYRRTRQEQRKLKSARKRLAAKTKSSSELKFTPKAKVPF